jgi:hypothetical protein
MPTKEKTGNSIHYSWNAVVHQGPKYGLHYDGLQHFSPVFPALVGAELRFTYDGAPHGGVLQVEMTADQQATSPWHQLAAENHGDSKRGELAATIPARVTDSEWSGAPLFIRCRFAAHTPPVDPVAMRLAQENGWPYEPPQLEGNHPVTLTLHVKEES